MTVTTVTTVTTTNITITGSTSTSSTTSISLMKPSQLQRLSQHCRTFVQLVEGVGIDGGVRHGGEDDQI